MHFGAHISAAGGLYNAPANSAQIGGECFQFFSRPPQGGKGMPLTDASIRQFKEAVSTYNQHAVYIHAPYYINLASTNNRIRYGSVSVLREELERGSALGVKAMMTHLGSANDLLKNGCKTNQEAEQKGLAMVVEGIEKILDGYKGSCQFLIEMSAGAGLVIGDTFEEIATILSAINKKLKAPVGICFDTQHAFGSGYDLRSAASQKKVFDEFDKKIGLARLVAMHCNDSKVELGSHKDRHEDLGDGFLGLSAFEAIVKNKKLKHVDLILETPSDEKRKRDLDRLKSFRT